MNDYDLFLAFAMHAKLTTDGALNPQAVLQVFEAADAVMDEKARRYKLAAEQVSSDSLPF